MPSASATNCLQCRYRPPLNTANCHPRYSRHEALIKSSRLCHRAFIDCPCKKWFSERGFMSTFDSAEYPSTDAQLHRPSQLKPSLLKQLKLSLVASHTSFQIQHRKVQTAYGHVEFHSDAVHVSRPGKASRQLPYHKVRLFQLVNWLSATTPAQHS